MFAKKTLCLILVGAVGVYFHFENAKEPALQPLSDNELVDSLRDESQSPNSLATALEKVTVPSTEAAAEPSREEVVSEAADAATKSSPEELDRLRNENPSAFVDRIQELLNSTLTSEVEKRDYYIHELSQILPDQTEKVAEVMLNELKLDNFSESARVMEARESDRLSRMSEVYFSAEKNKDRLLTGAIETANALRNSLLKEQFLQSFYHQFPSYGAEFDQKLYDGAATVPIQTEGERLPSSNILSAPDSLQPQ